MSCNDCQEKLLAFIRASGTTHTAIAPPALAHNIYTRRRRCRRVEFCPKCGAEGNGLHHVRYDATSDALLKQCNRCTFEWVERTLS